MHVHRDMFQQWVNGTLRRSTLSLGQEIPEWSSPELPPTSLERPRACHPRNVHRLYAARRYLSALQATRENRRLNRHVPGDSHLRSRETTRIGKREWGECPCNQAESPHRLERGPWTRRISLTRVTVPERGGWKPLNRTRQTHHSID